jgi:allantoinase
MPLNSIPPTTTVENLEIKRRSAKGQCYTDVGFWGGIIPGNEVSSSEYFEIMDDTTRYRKK